MKEASVITQLVIYNHVKVKNIKPETFVMTKVLVKSVK